jgi:hypothetical protein
MMGVKPTPSPVPAVPSGQPSETRSASSARSFFENPAEIRGDVSRGQAASSSSLAGSTPLCETSGNTRRWHTGSAASEAGAADPTPDSRCQSPFSIFGHEYVERNHVVSLSGSPRDSDCPYGSCITPGLGPPCLASE